jgi:hypothetical protein
MSTFIRHDAITLRSEASAEDLERFMKEELIPYFNERYRGPTRASRADLQNQSCLRDTQDQRKYLWVTAWTGSEDSVQGSSFEHARIGGAIEETKTMLKKLESFGGRTTVAMFRELVHTVVSQSFDEG